MLSMEDLQKKKCKPCQGGTAPMTNEQAQGVIAGLSGWSLSPDGKFIHKTFLMKGFSEAAMLIQKIAAVADEEDHHPDIHLTGYRKLLIELTTHAIKGLSENDFILAAKIEALPKELKPS